MTARIQEFLNRLVGWIDPSSERELAASLLGAIAIAGAGFGFLTYLLPHPEGTDFVPPSFAFAGSIIAGSLLWARRRTVGWGAIAVVVALGSLVVTVAMLSVPDRTGAYVTYYVWLGIFAFYFLRPRVALAQIVWIAALYGIAVAVDSPAGSVEQWVNGVATTLGVGLLILALRTRIAGLVGRLQLAAGTDQLTSLPNRRAFDAQLERELAHSARASTDVSLLLLDLDRFKQLNDTIGHVAGDEALRRVAEVIAGEVRPADWPARIGGDEFAVLLPGADEEEARGVATRLCRGLVEGFSRDPVPLRASVGVAASTAAEQSAEGLMLNADAALYLAKRMGGGRALGASELPDGARPGPGRISRTTHARVSSVERSI